METASTRPTPTELKRNQIISQLNDLTENQLDELLESISKYRNRYLETYPMIATQNGNNFEILDYSQDEDKYLTDKEINIENEIYNFNEIIPVRKKKVYIQTYKSRKILELESGIPPKPEV